MKNIVVFFLVFLVSSCKFFSGRTDYVIDEKDVVKILIEIHLIDGLYSVSEVRNKYKEDNLPFYYEKVFQKYGYTRSQLDSSLEYYSCVQGKLDDIYEKVVFELKKYEDINLTQEDIDAKIAELKKDNLWNKKQEWKLPEDSRNESLGFEYKLKGKGDYVISAKIKVYSDDESSYPSLTAFFCKKEGVKEEKADYRVKYFEKDGKEKEYRITLTLDNQDVTHLKGWILDHRNKTGEWEKHLEVNSISILYVPLNKNEEAASEEKN